MTHSFDINVAAEYGIEAAIIIQNLQFWISKNIANKTNKMEGKTWTYNSLSAWKELFPYMSPHTIKRVLSELAEKGVILKGNFNKNPYDKTNWFTFVDDAKWLNPAKLSIVVKTTIEESENNPSKGVNQPMDGSIGNAPLLFPQPSITDSNTDTKPNGSIGAVLSPLDQKKKEFYDQLAIFVGVGSKKYSAEMVRAFYDWWSESSQDGKKMRKEKEQFFEISKRLATWKRRDNEKAGNQMMGGKSAPSVHKHAPSYGEGQG